MADLETPPEISGLARLFAGRSFQELKDYYERANGQLAEENSRLQQEVQEAQTHKDELETRESDLRAREEALKKLEEELAAKKRELDAMEKNLDERQEAISEAEKRIGDIERTEEWQERQRAAIGVREQRIGDIERTERMQADTAKRQEATATELGKREAAVKVQEGNATVIMQGAVQLKQQAERMIEIFRDKNDISPEIPQASVNRDKILLDALTNIQARIEELIAQKKISDGTKRTSGEIAITQKQIAELKGTLIGIIRCYTDTLPQQELASFSIDGKSALVFLQEKIKGIDPQYIDEASKRADEIYTTLIGGESQLPSVWVERRTGSTVGSYIDGTREELEMRYEKRKIDRPRIFNSIKSNEIQTLGPNPRIDPLSDGKHYRIYYGENTPVLIKIPRTVDRGNTDNVVENAAREVVEVSRGMDRDFSKKTDESEQNAKPEEPSDDDDAR